MMYLYVHFNISSSNDNTGDANEGMVFNRLIGSQFWLSFKYTWTCIWYLVIDWLRVIPNFVTDWQDDTKFDSVSQSSFPSWQAPLMLNDGNKRMLKVFRIVLQITSSYLSRDLSLHLFYPHSVSLLDFGSMNCITLSQLMTFVFQKLLNNIWYLTYNILYIVYKIWSMKGSYC